MKINEYLKKKELEQRIAKLEKYVTEKTTWRDEPSKAYLIWKYLMDNGPSTIDAVRREFPPKISSNVAIKFFSDNNLISKDGNILTANADYNWDDVGVIPRTADQELMQSLRNVDISNLPMDDGTEGDEEGEDAAEETPAHRGRRPRTPREPRQPQVKANLFSRKYAEVKAAIDAGQSVTTTNEKGKTPLMYAVGDPKGESGHIIELLLSNGADANDIDGNKPVLFTAILRHNKEGVKSLVDHGANLTMRFGDRYPMEYAFDKCGVTDDMLTYLAIRALPERVIRRVTELHGQGKISDAVFKSILDKIFTNAESLRDLYNSIVLEDMYHGSTMVLDKFIELGHFPDIAVGLGSIRNDAAHNKVYDLIGDVSSGKLNFNDDSLDNFLLAALKACGKLKKPTTEVLELLTPEVINRLDDVTCNELVETCIDGNLVEALNKIAKQKRDDLSFSRILTHLAERGIRNGVDSNTVKAACKVMRYLDKERRISGWDIDRAIRCGSRYLLDFLIDSGLGNRLAYYAKVSGYRLDNKTRETLIAALNDADIDYTNAQDEGSGNMYGHSYYVGRIVDLINNDEWRRSADEWIKDDPSILEDDKVLKAIERNNNFTSRQVQRKIDALPKDVYDF